MAAFATVLGRSYEDVAGLLDVALDPKTNGAEPDMKGVPFCMMAPVALRLGLSATTVFSATPHVKETQSAMFQGVSREELRAMIEGRDAVLGAAVIRKGQFVIDHALAWKGGHLVDCGDGFPPGTSFDDSGAYIAVIIAPLPDRQASQQPE